MQESLKDKPEIPFPKYNLQKIRTKYFSGEVLPMASNSTDKWEYGDGKTAEKLKIVSWNVNGYRRFNDKFLYQYLTNSIPDILCFQETKMTEAAFDSNPVKLDGFNGYWNFCKCSNGYSGVMVFSRYKAIKTIEDFPNEAELSQEGRMITLEFERFFVVCVYSPSSGSNLERIRHRVDKFDPAFEAHCQALRKDGKSVIVCGDINVVHQGIDMYRKMEKKQGKNKYKTYDKEPGCTEEERNNLSRFFSKGWHDLYRQLHPTEQKYTWWNKYIYARPRNIGRRIDYIIVDMSCRDFVQSAEVQDKIMGSDHCPVVVVIQFPKIEDNKSQELTQKKQKDIMPECHFVELKKTDSNYQEDDLNPLTSKFEWKYQLKSDDR